MLVALSDRLLGATRPMTTVASGIYTCATDDSRARDPQKEWRMGFTSLKRCHKRICWHEIPAGNLGHHVAIILECYFLGSESFGPKRRLHASRSAILGAFFLDAEARSCGTLVWKRWGGDSPSYAGTYYMLVTGLKKERNLTNQPGKITCYSLS